MNEGYYGSFTGQSSDICDGGCAAGLNLLILIVVYLNEGYYGSTSGLTTSTCSGYCTAGNLNIIII